MPDTSIDSISIRHFKAFRDFQLNLEGRHLLAYGANGSGKSSLYWALYTFLESAGKSTDEIWKYFDPANPQSLVNIHVSAPENETAFIKLILKGDRAETFEISATEHQTRDKPVIAKASLACDFITYRFIFKFSDFRNSQSFDFWGLFEREILPFCRTTSGLNLHYEWRDIASDQPHGKALVGGAITKARKEYHKKLAGFNSEFSAVFDAIATKAKEFYAEHFADTAAIEIELGITNSAHYDRTTKTLRAPNLQLGIKDAGKVIHRPHVYLNEAKLTQIAISIRFAASLVNLNDSPIKLLVLDDLLVSLDLSNRMKIVEILLSDTFDHYQKIILTHDLGFFREFRRMIGVKHTNWCFKRFHGNAVNGVQQRDEKSEVEKAEGYIRNHDLEEAAACLRKAAEDTAVQYRELKEGIRIGSEKFASLSQQLGKAKKAIKARIPEHLFEQVLHDIDPTLLAKLVAYVNDDLDADADLDDATRSLLKERRQSMKEFLSSEGWKDYQDIEILDRILKMTERVLNPASHWGEPALYQAEVQKALTLINRLEKCLISVSEET